MKERFETFTVLITKISRSIRRIKTEEMQEFNLKVPHVSCLYYIYKEKALTPKHLCELCEEDKASISRSLDYLESNGFLTRSDDERKYKKSIRLTEKGKSAGKIVAEKIDNILDIAGEGLSDEERTTFYRSLTLISDNLQKICDKYEEK